MSTSYEVLALPETRVAHWTQRVQLSGQNYLLELQWVEREARWYFRLATEQDETIFGLRKVVANWDLLRTLVSARRPPGELWALDTSGAETSPGFDDLGARVQLVYVQDL